MYVKTKKSYGKSFIVFPIAFLFLGYLLLFLAIAPIAKPFLSIVNMAFLDKPISDSQGYDSLFDISAQLQAQGEIKASEIEFPKYGNHFGKLVIEDTNINTDLFFGDGTQQLKNGAGVYNGSAIPGYGKTVLIGGHNHTHFKDLKNAQVGSKVTITTNYGEYVYEITQTAIKKATDKTAYDLSASEENLVLYTCYPFNSWGLTPDRYFVYGKYLSGPHINIYE